LSCVRVLRSDLQFTVVFQNSWISPERASELTYAQIASGVDVIFADAPGVATIASDSDIPVIGSFDGLIKAETDTIVTSARWHFEPTLHAALDQIRGHHVTGMDFGFYSYMRHGGCSLAPISVSADRIPEEAIERVAQREADMRSLRFTANVNPQRPFSGLFPVFE
ncbi:MAG: BMP family ABC transporter substrate-binding protein, partial [Rhodobacteraceae bacterium]|nr:BMP family ABC transporter substrate-binding protein [Paracoccaceae bacterium]